MSRAARRHLGDPRNAPFTQRHFSSGLAAATSGALSLASDAIYVLSGLAIIYMIYCATGITRAASP